MVAARGMESALMAAANAAIGADARKEIGLGMPPEQFGSNAGMALADQCSPQSRIVVVEDARWRIDLPISDASMGTFGDRFSPWLTPDGQPPPGVTTATNTLATPGIFAQDMIIRGVSVRVLVEPEARLIRGGLFNPGGAASQPGQPDVASQSDIANGALGLAAGQSAPTPAELLWGMATWKVAYALENAYELVLSKSHQDRLIQEPLTAIARIEPFAEAEAAGLVYGSNQDRIAILNARLTNLGQPTQFLPTNFKRLGVATVAGAPVGVFTPSREEDASQTMFGGIGVTQNLLQTDPFLFTHPIFWPAGHPCNLQFQVNDQAYQAEMQRWLSVTGGIAGNPGNDLNLPYSIVPGLSGPAPTTPGSPAMLEQSLDLLPVLYSQQVQTNRAILKGGTMVIELGIIGFRVGSPGWRKHVASAIKSGAISAPNGYGALGHLMGD
jgi:hypothetical protein